MKLNLEIIYEGLSETIGAELLGVREKELHLGRPEYYLETDRTFRAGHLYIVRGEQLPPRPSVEKGTGLICIGSSMALPYYLEYCGVIQIRGKADRHQLFNLLTQLYNRYDAWWDELQGILNTSGSIRDMIRCSHKLFDTPMYVLNANFHFLAHSGYSDTELAEWEKKLYRPNGSGELGLPLLSTFLEYADLATQKREAMLINILDSSTLCVNLFLDKVYSGCLVIEYRQRRYRPSDNALAEHLARMLELALQKYSAPAQSTHGSLRQGLQDLIRGIQLDAEQRWALENLQNEGAYLCAKIKFHNRLAELPMDYMCSTLEKSFPNSVAFAFDGSIVGFLAVQTLEAEGKHCHQALRERILPLTASMSFDIGVSDPFGDIYSARLYYLQASSALENGKLFAPSEHFHLFQDHALSELLVNAFGRLPVEMYFTDGLRKLAEHDATSPVSYLQTLHTYLDNNMSITKTTASLYINRSTLLERIARIKRDLGIDLQDPDERLRLQIVLKALQFQKDMQGKNV